MFPGFWFIGNMLKYENKNEIIIRERNEMRVVYLFTVGWLRFDFSVLLSLVHVYEPGGAKPNSTCALFSVGENCSPLSENGIVGASAGLICVPILAKWFSIAPFIPTAESDTGVVFTSATQYTTQHKTAWLHQHLWRTRSAQRGSRIPSE